MNIFKIHKEIVKQYKDYIGSFVNIEDQRISKVVQENLDNNVLCPSPLIQFNPNFKFGDSIVDLVKELDIDPTLNQIFSGYRLFQHQEDAIRLGQRGVDFVVTSGTGSGKSLTYLANIFDHVLKNQKRGIKALLVYPMNALINSQEEELRKFENNCNDQGAEFGITFRKYTGQESEKERNEVRENLPDVLLTNYMMLELIMTKENESSIRDSLMKDLKFLVFDELHTYKGRQGADVALLIRRIKAHCNQPLFCIGTSATMSSGTGTIQDQKQDVAHYASKIFGQTFMPENIVNETILPLTPKPESDIKIEVFSKYIQAGVSDKMDEKSLHENPIVQWIEHQIGLKLEGNIYLRNKVCSLEDLIANLSDLSGESIIDCQKYLQELLQLANTINEARIKNGKRETYIPFRLHQFISQTGSVYVTLEARDTRQITLSPGYYAQSENEDNLKIYPVMFSRLTGHDFICVSRDPKSQILSPRDFRDIEDNGDNESEEELNGNNSGYLILPKHEDDDALWNDDKISELPETWYKKDKQGLVKIDSKKKELLPNIIFIDKFGNYKTESFDGGIKAWYMPAKLAFDPTCMAFYDLKTNEGSKLTGLGNEGRSTATTTLTLAAIDALRKNGVNDGNQKLLSFTDNRQDASLQTGHFNDLVNVTKIRSALYQALKDNPDHHLDVTNVGNAVVRALKLDQSEFAKLPATSLMASTDNEKCLNDYLTIRLIQDLKRGWRYVLPNLESCALLNIEYKYLHEEASNDQNWQNIPYLNQMTHEERFKFLKNTLDFIRTSKAISHSFFYENKDIVENNIRERLNETWGLEKEEKIELPFLMRYKSLGKRISEPTVSMGIQSQWGRYLKSTLNFDKNVIPFESFCEMLLNSLAEMQYLSSKPIRGEKETGNGYSLNATCILWTLGNGKSIQTDPIRIRSNQQIELKPNQFFKELYEKANATFKKVTSAEHTGQIGNEIRKQREEDFRNGKLNTLFCSPTMELGIDIKDLSIVHLRNVPPSPANYAQRSGRAGRSGQGALVMTYCSQYSPHDRNYFNRKEEMVSGTVKPPRIDITNSELILAHVNAIYLMVAGLNFRNSIKEIIDEDTDSLYLKDDLNKKLYEGHSARKDTVIEMAKKVLSYSSETLKENRTLELWIDQIPESFNLAFNRWRKLYNQAKESIAEARLIKDNSSYTANSPERKEAKRKEYFGQSLIDKLRNDEESGKSNSLSEFYPYRYLASEGFLPGYNFTKLPNRVMLRKASDDVEFIERPRLIAISEFGPRNMVYHNGATYELNRIIHDNNKITLTDAKISKETGYIMMGEEYSRETCPITGVALSGQNDYIISDLIPHSFSEARARQKINCEEEERRRMGYKLETFFSQPAGTHTSSRLNIMGGENDHLLDFIYMPTAKIVVINHKWNRTLKEGFYVDTNTGLWKKESDVLDKGNSQISSVKLYTDYTADALYIQPMAILDLDKDGIITFQYALKRAIEEIFQIESNEISVITIGNEKKPNILIYESTEGSLGILKELTNDISLFKKVIDKAYEICHFESGKDVSPEKGPASYDDLLSYYNQRDHAIINRHSIKTALEKLQNCFTEIKPKNFESYDAQFKSLIAQVDPSSELEAKFLGYLYKNNLRLPNSAQKSLMHLDLYIKPDFEYGERIFIFCDGSVHDQAAVKEQDRQKRNALRRRGLRFIEIRYDIPFEKVIEDNKDIFIKVK